LLLATSRGTIHCAERGTKHICFNTIQNLEAKHSPTKSAGGA
jgi:hypothetical protein